MACKVSMSPSASASLRSASDWFQLSQATTLQPLYDYTTPCDSCLARTSTPSAAKVERSSNLKYQTRLRPQESPCVFAYRHVWHCKESGWKGESTHNSKNVKLQRIQGPVPNRQRINRHVFMVKIRKRKCGFLFSCFCRSPTKWLFNQTMSPMPKRTLQ